MIVHPGPTHQREGALDEAAGGRPLRVVAISHTGLVSGAELVLVRALVAGAERGWTVRCLSPAGVLQTHLRAAGVATTTVPDLTLPSGPRLLGSLAWMARSAQASRALRQASRDSDVVLVNGLRALPTVRLSMTDTPVVWLVHDVIRRAPARLMLQASKGALDLAVTVSNAVLEQLPNGHFATVVIPNGTPWPVEPAHEQPEGPPVVGCSAILTPWKGQDVLLEAVAGIPRNDVVVELMGATFPKDGGYQRALEQRAQQPDLAGRVRFLGHVAEPLERMRNWTVCVSASVEPEAGPLSMLEAMSIGLPVVVTAHGGPAEVVGQAGVLVPPGDTKSMGAALERILDDPAMRRRQSVEGRRAVAEGYVMEDRLDELLDAVAGVAAGR